MALLPHRYKPSSFLVALGKKFRYTLEVVALLNYCLSIGEIAEKESSVCCC
jgi:hypothetical protein